MEQYQLLFARTSHVAFLRFGSELDKLIIPEDQWTLESPIETRGAKVTAKVDLLRILGKKKDRKKLLSKIIRALVTIGGLSGGWIVLSEAPSTLLFEIHIHNTEINIVSPDRKESVTIDSTNLELEIHKIDSLSQ